MTRARLLALVPLLVAVPVLAAEIGQVKTAAGSVVIERAGATTAAKPGVRIETSDVVRTGPDGSVGITMSDNALISLGPNSVLSLDSFAFDTTTYQGKFDTTLTKGSLAVVSGKIAKQSPDAMKVRTPASVLGVRGTEFAVKVD
jgi:hypothetical protein